MSKFSKFSRPTLWIFIVFGILTTKIVSAADKSSSTTPVDSYAVMSKARDAKKIPGVNHTTQVPSNFPLPVYSKNVLTTSFCNKTSGQPMASVIIVTKDSPKTVFDWYQLQCGSTWKVSVPPDDRKVAKEKDGSLYRMTALKDEHQISITCSKKKSGNTAISIYWILKKRNS